jgi:hypothetical protein
LVFAGHFQILKMKIKIFKKLTVIWGGSNTFTFIEDGLFFRLENNKWVEIKFEGLENEDKNI